MPKKKVLKPLEVSTTPFDDATEAIIRSEFPEYIEVDTDNTGAQTEFVVTNSGGAEVRTYTVDIHGENAGELAKQYASKIGGSVR
jgi:hypothetical protein